MKQQSDLEREAQKYHIQPIVKQTSLQQQIRTRPIKEQIQKLNEEINKLENNDDLTNYQQQFQKDQYQQQLFKILKDQDEVKSIPHVKQNIEASNPDLLLYVLKESLLRDQNRELRTNKYYSFGFDSIIGAYGQDQSCFKVRNTNLDYDTIVNDNQLLQHHLVEFKENLSSSLNIPIDQIEILGVSKGSCEINFQIEGKTMDDIKKHINNNSNASKFLNTYCNGKIEYVMYFDQARARGCSGVILSFDDFNHSHNMSWDNFHEKEQRGPSYHRYDYYFPIGCYGFGLNVKKYGNNQDWLKMDGNPNEWRIMYHGTKNFAVNSIVKNNLKDDGYGQAYSSDICKGGKETVGIGIYFSDRISVCVYDENKYAPFTQVGNKQFAVIFMSRVDPKKIKQSQAMEKKNYFVVNKKEHVRPYRILLYEKK